MEDLRENYNVSQPKSNKKTIWSNVVSSNQNIIKLFFYLVLISFIVFKPKVIGSYVGKWFNSLTESFSSVVTMSSDNWYTILITISCVTVCYTLVKWVNNH